MELDTVIENIQEVFSGEYEEDEIFAVFKKIPSTLWEDRSSSLQIIEAIVRYKDWEWDIDVTAFIPESYWDNKVNAVEAAKIILGSRRDDIYAYFPAHLWKNRDFVLTAVRSNWSKIYDLSKKFTKDPEIVHTALYYMIAEVEDRIDNDPRIVTNPRYFLEDWLCCVSVSLKSNKAFILSSLKTLGDSIYFMDECDLLFDWVDSQLWSDKEFVTEAVKADYSCIKRVSEELKSDDEFMKFLEDL